MAVWSRRHSKSLVALLMTCRRCAEEETRYRYLQEMSVTTESERARGARIGVASMMT